MRHFRGIPLVIFAAAIVFSGLSPTSAEVLEVGSPNGRLKATVNIGPELTYSVIFDGKNVIEPSRLGIEFRNEKPFGELRLKEKKTTSHETKWEYPWSRQREYLDKYNSLEISLEEKDGGENGRKLGLTFRAYDDGIAFRYTVEPGVKNVFIESETTEFNIPGDPYAWFADVESFNSNYEKEPPNSFIACPVVVKLSETGPYMALKPESETAAGFIFAERKRSLQKSFSKLKS